MTTTIDALFNVADFVTEEERAWQMKAREFAQTRIKPVIDQDFEDRRLRIDLIKEVGALGFFGMYMEG